MNRRNVSWFLALLLLAGSAHNALALYTDVYSLRGTPTNNIYLVNLFNGNDSAVYTNYPGGGAATLAMRSSDGNLFYVVNATNGVLYRWNPLTPATAPAPVGSGIGAGIPGSLRLTFAQDGRLFYMPNTNLYTINQTTGVATLFATITGSGTGGDMVFGSDGTLYIVSNTTLYTAPINGGAATSLGTISGITGSVVGLAWDPADRLIICTSIASGSAYYSVNVSTRVATRLGDATGAASTGDLASAPTQRISGKVFEDVNYGGGAGRSLATSAGVGRAGARVELYQSDGLFVAFTTTDASGNYSLAGVAGQSYFVRVVSSSVTSSRTGASAGLLPVQTYRTDAAVGGAAPTAVTDRVGGETPNLADAGNGATGVTLASLTTGSARPQTLTPVTTTSTVGGMILGVDFGFNFDTIVNTNDAGQGSLRQFITNANTLGNTGLAQVGQAAGKEVSIFMITDGAVHPGLRAGLTNQLTSGVARITLASILPAVTGADTTLDGATQTTNIGDTNAATLGTGGTVGVGALSLGQVAGPEVEVRSGATIANGFILQGANASVRNFAILGFGAASGDGAVRVAAGGTAALVENNALGTLAASLADPGAALRNYQQVVGDGATGGTIRNNVLAFAAKRGIFLQNNATGWSVTGNEIRDSGLGDADGDGLAADTASATATGNLIVGSSSQGVVFTNASGSVVTNNTVSGNGVGISGSLVQSAGITLRSTSSATTFDRNIIRANHGAGIAVNNGASAITITRNSIFDNGTIGARNGAAATSQIGIDLNTAADNANLGTAPYYTVNAAGARTGGNALLNYPVLASAIINGSNMTVTGYAKPGSVIELFLTDGDPSGFGEGKTYLTTLTEGSAADTDSTTGTYSGVINGVNQGTDTTNKFSFTIPTPGGVVAGGKLTATGTLANATSEFSGAVTAALLSISGRVFEDLNYGGGGGRDFTAASGSGCANATVELYDASGAFVSSTVTDASGNYTFNNVTAGNNTLRVVNSTVTSSRPGYVAGLLPVQTFRTNGLTGSVGTPDPNRVGGENPAVTGAGAGASGTVLDTSTGAFTAGISGQAQSLTTLNIGAASVTEIDFGFNFDTIVNVNSTGQGSLRQFITNANALGNAGLAQAGQTAGLETSIFMISDGTAHPGLRVGLANQLTAGVAVISLTSALPALTGAGTTVAGSTQTANVGNTNAAILGAGGVVGVDNLPLPTVPGPEVEIRDAAGLNVGFDVRSANTTVRGCAIFGFGNVANSDLHANILLNNSASNALIEQNILGSAANTFTDPGAGARSGGDNIRAVGSLSGTIRNNLIGFSPGKGIELYSSANGWSVTGNELRGNGIGNPNLDGIDVENGSGSTTITGNLAIANEGVGFDSYLSSGGNTISNNTASGNGTGTGANQEDMGIRIFGANNLVSRNIATANPIAGITVTANASQTVISRNSVFANGQIGIDLNSASDNNKIGTAPYVTPNDNGDGDTGGNGLLNFPVITQASISGGNLILEGFARPGAVIELFLAQPGPANFGEGKTYLVTLTEGSAQDTDNTTGSYTNPVNGLNQGADTTNRFAFTIPTPSGIAVGTVLTATATLASATSEFSGNVIVAGSPTGLISGSVYEDANLNLFRDSAEIGTGLTLYVKIIDAATPAGPALAAAVVDPATGGYTTNPLGPGNYTLILDDNNTLSDVTPTLPLGWTATESSGGVRTPVPVASIPVPNQNFGLYHGILVSGRVFTDTGIGGGTANDGTLNGSEAGIAGVVVKLTDTTGATVHSTATTNGAGDYALALPSTIAAGTALKITETNSNSFVSTGATVGNTAGTYSRATDTISFSVAANTTYTNVNFGDVPPNTLSTDGQQAGLPGTTIYYPHTFTAGSVGSVTFSAANVQTPPLAGWTSTLYRDTNGNGQFDAGEPAITGPLTVAAGETIFVIVKVAIPTTAAFGAGDTAKLSANFTYTGASPALTAALSRKDVTTVGNPTTSGLRLTKTVDKPSALPGENINYTITYTNVSSDALRNVIIYDATPAFTKFVSGNNGALPLDLTSVVLTAPASGAAGAMRWTFAGTLTPGGTGTVSFVVQLDR